MKNNVVVTYNEAFRAVELAPGQFVAGRKSHKTAHGTTVWEALDRRGGVHLGTRSQILKAVSPYLREQDAAKLAKQGAEAPVLDIKVKAEVKVKPQDIVTVIETVDYEAVELLPGQFVAARRLGDDSWQALDRKGKAITGSTLEIVDACDPYKTAKAAQARAEKGEAV